MQIVAILLGTTLHVPICPSVLFTFYVWTLSSEINELIDWLIDWLTSGLLLSVEVRSYFGTDDQISIPVLYLKPPPMFYSIKFWT